MDQVVRLTSIVLLTPAVARLATVALEVAVFLAGGFLLLCGWTSLAFVERNQGAITWMAFSLARADVWFVHND